jgi:hypothetical protein
MSEKRKILALRITAWNGRHHRTRRVDSGLLAQEIVGDRGITNPNVHLAADGRAENTVVLIAELFHRIPGRIGVDIMDTPDIRNRAHGPWEELEAWRRSVSQSIFNELNRGDKHEDGRSNEPFVSSNGIESVLSVEKSVGGLVSVDVVVNLCHNDRRRYRGRHGGGSCLASMKACRRAVRSNEGTGSVVVKNKNKRRMVWRREVAI